jgi:RimJ/RimL family protein N-acetyltransferase
MPSVSRTHGLHVSLLVDEDRQALERFLDTDRRGTLYLRSLVHEYGVSPTPQTGHGRFFGASRDGRILAVAFLGNSRNLTTWGPPSEVEAVLDRAIADADGPRLFVGPAEHAGLIRGLFSRTGVIPSLDRAQAYYILTPETLVGLDPSPIRPAEPSDLSLVAPAHASMTEEDLKIPKSHLDMSRLREISRQRIAQGKVWVVVEDGTLVFKTEEAARSDDGILVGGVFTDPSHRGKGEATRALAAWAEHLFRDGLQVMALHVNAANTPAVRAYEHVGYRPYSMLRLMLAY